MTTPGFAFILVKISRGSPVVRHWFENHWRRGWPPLRPSPQEPADV